MAGPWCFAWAGGTIEEQVTVVTTGTTHGGQTESLVFVGDIDAGTQIMRLAQADTFTEGALYSISGPGVGASAIYDSTISATSTLSLSSAASASGHSATYTATRAQPLGAAVVSLVEGSDTVAVVSFDGTLYPGGTYSISAFAIGDAHGLPVSTAYLSWDGSAGTMWTVLQPTAGGIEAAPVVAIASGDFQAEISGFASGDWYAVTGIPSAALSGLTEGLIYNVAGNGIPAGTTFTAPASGATSIVLDQPGSAAVANSLLTITGPRTPNAPFDPAVHNRFDEDVLSVEISQTEGDFATLTVELRNPGLGLLAAGRNLWCWLSWDPAWPDGVPDLIPLFNGRLIGVPRLSAGEGVQLQFLARPDDYIAQKGALADSLQVLPYFDPVWISGEAGPDTVLETYSALWHIDRTSLTLTISDIVQGEDGTIEIGEDRALYDNFSLSYGEPPLSAVSVSGTVSWQQRATGMLDLTQTVLDAFRDQAGAPFGRVLAGSPHHATLGTQYRVTDLQFSGGALIQVLSGDGLLNSWPKAGSNIGAGWSFPTGVDGAGVPLNYVEDPSDQNKSGAFTEIGYDVSYATNAGNSINAALAAANIFGGGGDYIPYNDGVMQILNKGQLVQVQVSFPTSTLHFRMVAEYKADRRRTETVNAVMVADVQRQLSDSADSDRETITLTSDFVGQGVDIGGGIPITDLSYKSYFQTTRGTASLEYLLLAARAKLRARARSVEITFAVDWRTALGIGLRHSVLLLDRRLPGGSATGKVKSYTLRCNDGVQIGEFTIGATIGNGTPSEAAAGAPTYVDEGYVEPGWQVYAGAQTMLLADEFAYETLEAAAIDDDGVNLANLSRENAVRYCIVVNGMKDQVEALQQYQGSVAPTNGDPLATMREMMTTVTLDLVPLTGAEFHTDFFPALSQLSLPKTIDLAAGA